VQRALEAAGVATVSITLLREVSESLRVPRAYYVPYPFGHALGEPLRLNQQRAVFHAALDLLETAREPGTIVDSPFRWRRTRFD
jgi:D-proline reductase (dithiol) PrdB